MSDAASQPCPPTRRDEVVDLLHGVEIVDPYRWLEDPDSSETAAWVAAQNEYSEAALASYPSREWFRQCLADVVMRPRHGVVERESGWWFVSRNDGTQAQDVWYAARSLRELEAGGRLLLDPNTFSDDGKDSLSRFSVSDDGRWLTYGISRGGSDWLEFHTLDLETFAETDRPVFTAKFCRPEWLPDNASFLLTEFPAGGPADGTSTTALEKARLVVRSATGEHDDVLVWEDPEHPRLMPYASVSHGGEWVEVYLSEGTEAANRLWLYPVVDEEGCSRLGEPVRVADTADASYAVIGVIDGEAYLLTTKDAPRGRIVRVDLEQARTGEAELVEVIGQGMEPIASAKLCGGLLLVERLIDATPEVTRYALDGEELGVLDLLAGGILGFAGSRDEDEAVISVSDIVSRCTSYAVSASSGQVRRLDLADPASSELPAYDIAREHATSADGTVVPYWVIRGRDAAGDQGPRPVFMWAYGGFNVPMLATYRPLWPAWLAAGGTLVIANIRGGGEFGQEWYEAGKRATKQNCYDDFHAVAEHLIATGVTTSEQLAIHGRSNGGLLIGVLTNQRPDLYGAAIPAVGVMDLLRFHKFTIGAAWISDFGDPDDPAEFPWIRGLSPLHNIVEGTAYPPTLVVTSDHDDRVVPLHSHKYTATLQAAQGGSAPVISRIETAAGHGAGMSNETLVAEGADVLAFAAHHTGLVPPRAEMPAAQGR